LVVSDHAQLSIQRQCQLLGVSRSSYYYQPQEISDEQLTLLRLLDEQYLKTPFYGSRRLTVYLRSLGYEINRKRVIRLMRQLGLQTVYPRKRTTISNQADQIYPYKLSRISGRDS